MSGIMPKLDKMSKLYETYKKTYDIKFCDLDEIDEVVDFIDTYWKKGHILVKSRTLMDWQHLDRVNKRYNFVLARHRATGEIHALLGFITTQFYDPEIKNTLLWGAIWKTRDDVKAFGLGILLYYYLKINLNIETLCLSGISEDGKRNYKSLGFFTGREEQYFFPNPEMKEFHLACGIEKYQNKNFKNSDDWKLKELFLSEYNALNKNAEYFMFDSRYKSKEYYKNRYFLHPMYKYHFYALMQREVVKAIMIIRESPANGGDCIRLVEFVGNYSYMENVKASISNLLKEKNCEYLDLVLTGIDDTVLNKGGFINIRSDIDIVIPNYFEPYLAKNIDIGYAYISTDPNLHLIITKGDADQDRPSKIE
ncbi:hypothetical protein [Treponema socranskii]|uniref:hypothetical protein n=1 Tax=Treponema socranskii TaxID=53419 RepID=UPI003D6E5708